jgi:hypothetical protein
MAESSDSALAMSHVACKCNIAREFKAMTPRIYAIEQINPCCSGAHE